MISKIIPAIRMLASKDEILTVRFDNRASFLTLNCASDLTKFSFVDKDAAILVLDKLVDNDEVISNINEQLSVWYETNNFYPNYILLQGIGVIALAQTAAEIGVLFGETEKPIIKIKGRVYNKIVVVTGGAQGFGGGIAEMLFAEGANVVVADLNETAGNELVEKLNLKQQSNQAYFVKTNVAEALSVENMVAETVRYFGGLDIIVSNAGILRAGDLDEMTPETFALMTNVNYNGYFHCAKYASVVMKIQARYRKNYFMDIIQINSKSGLKGSNRNFAYSGGKFGGIGLTQSFALELMPHRIKVNSVCPGNFFEGPLWSDPDNGLFVQYLRAGKVPGATTIDDVKSFYEAQVPAGRGCRVIDVVRAIFYIVEQEYETGQAIPVTGGQNMLN